MEARRIGNDIKISWEVKLKDTDLKLEDLDLSVEVRLSDELVDWHNYEEEPTIHKHEHKVVANGGIGIYSRECMEPRGRGDGAPCRPPIPPIQLPFYVEDNTIIAVWSADAQFALGEYDILLIAHNGDGGQATVDQYRVIRLVAHTAQADADEDSGVESIIAMQPVTLTFPGLSAYDVAVSQGFTGTKAEWLQSLKQPAEDAAAEAKEYGDYAKAQGDYAKAQGDNIQDAITQAKEALEKAESVISDAERAVDAATETAEHPTYVGEDNYIYEWDAVNGKYVQTAKFVKAQPLTIDVKYKSVAALQLDATAYNDGLFAIVDTGDVEDDDNGRLYIRKDGAWEFVVDMSGVRGETGRTPQIAVGTVSLGANLSDAAVTLTANGVDDNDNPKYNLNFIIPRLTYDDLTAEQIAELQKPASDMITTLNATNEAVKESEEGRVKSEELRVSAETARATAEAARVDAETKRATAEAARAAAETAREKSETTRSGQEVARQLNESNRETAESARQTNTQTAIDNTNAAAEEAKATAETAAAEAKATAEAAAEDVKTHMPKIVEGYWALWDKETEEYVKTTYRAIGYSPYVSAAETWMVYNDETGAYEDSGQSISSAYNLTKDKVEAVLTGYITSHKHSKAQIEEELTGDITTHNHATQLATLLQGYVQKVTGKDLSSNDFTDELKTKLEGLSNYDDAALQTAITTISGRIDTLVSGSSSDAIDTFNEIVAFLAGYTDTQTLSGILAALQTTIEAKIPEAAEELTDAEIEEIMSE